MCLLPAPYRDGWVGLYWTETDCEVDRTGLQLEQTDGVLCVCKHSKTHAGHTTILAPDGEEDDGDGGRTRGEKETGELYHDRLC